uniref:Uncharacterized protein n=1 Tax=Arcella intermedia TaxID=1963864 RepID=A0A6B2LI43_9EUKA
MSAYREAIGAPPPTKSDISSGEDEGEGEGEGEGDGQGADTNSEGDGESDKEGERDGEDGEDKDNTESKEKEQDSSKSGSGSSKSGSSKSDSEEEEEEGDEVQIISPSIPASWGKPDTHVGGLWYVGFKVQDLDKWLSSQSKAPSDYNCIFYSHNVNKEDEEDALLVHTVWRIQGEPEEGTFKEYSEGLVDDENNFLMLEMIENDCRGFT